MTKDIFYLDIKKKDRSNSKEEKNEPVIKYFNKYFDDVENISEVAHQILEDIFKYYGCEINTGYINILINYSMSHYKNVEYHNFNHAVNTLYTGSAFMKILYEYKISKYDMNLFVFCCLFHDIGHPGLTGVSTNLDYEHIHIGIIKKLLSTYPKLLIFGDDRGKVKNEDEILLEIQELVFSTNLIMHESVIKEFKCKYYVLDKYKENIVNKDVAKEIRLIELKMLIKIADISAIYKEYTTQQKSSCKLNKEIFGKDFKSNIHSLKEDLFFIQNFAIPLIDLFSKVFIEFRFMYDNCRHNLEKIKEEIA